MWHVTNQKLGASALGLQRVLGLGSYQTAWAWLHKIRRAMVRPGRERLSGLVEVDETYVGGLEEGVRGRQTEKKAIVVIAVEIRLPKGFGRVRLGRVPVCGVQSYFAEFEEGSNPASATTLGWETAFEAVLNANQENWADDCMVQRINAAGNLFNSGTKVRITLRGSTNNALMIKKAYISQAASPPDAGVNSEVDSLASDPPMTGSLTQGHFDKFVSSGS